MVVFEVTIITRSKYLVVNSAAADIDGLSDAKAGGDNFSNSIIIGHQTTGTLNNATSNTAIGVTAMEDITSGDGNTAFGLGSMKNVTSGSSQLVHKLTKKEIKQL